MQTSLQHCKILWHLLAFNSMARHGADFKKTKASQIW